MPVQYFTLNALCNELRPAICGSTITDVFTQNRNELLISIQKSDKHNDKVHKIITVSVEPRNNYFLVRDIFTRAKKNSVNLFDQIIGMTIEDFSLHPSDRIIYLNLQNSFKLVLQLYNTIESNIFLVDRNDLIIESFKNNKRFSSTAFIHAQRFYSNLPLNNFEDFKNGLIKSEKDSVLLTLKKIFPLTSKIYIHEILYRAGILEDASKNELDEKILHDLYDRSQKVFAELSHPVTTIYSVKHKEKILSLIKLNHLKEYSSEIFSSVNEAVRTFVRRSFSSQNISNEKESLLHKLKQELNSTIRAMDKINSVVTSAPGEQEEIGKILLSNLHAISKGMKFINLPATNDNSLLIKISLNPALSPVQNAEHYFEKAKRLKTANDETLKRAQYLEKKSIELKKIISSLEACQANGEIKQFYQNYNGILKSMKLISENSDEELPPFRIFTIIGGFQVWVGKSSANNDLLTMKYAKQNDIWFHTRGAGGSHTVLRVPKSVKKIPKESIVQAASIAAYYSKMRNAGSVPVAYCERKFVHKRKGAQEGTVFLDREEVILVKPGLP